MKSNTANNIALNQVFKITKSDENISNYLIDCDIKFNYKENKKVFNGIS